MLSQNSTAHTPSFSRTWLELVPALSSPHSAIRPASSRLPKNFHPVGVSKQSMPSAAATRSTARLVGIERATPGSPSLNHGMRCALAARIARLSLGPIAPPPVPAGDHHVAVAVAVRGGAEIRRIGGGERGDQIGGVERVRIGMMAAEIGQRLGIDRGAGGRAEPTLEDLARIGAGHRAHRVEAQPEAAAEQVAQPVEIEDALHQRGVIGDRVDDRDLHRAKPRRRRAWSSGTSAASTVR